MATVISIINCATEDYNTLALWEDATDIDLVTATSIHQADCYNDDGALTAGCTLAGATSSSSYYRIISSPSGERHNGTTASGFTIDVSSRDQNGIIIDENYAIVEWLIVKGFGPTFTNAYTGITASTTDRTGIVVRNNIIDGEGAINTQGIYLDYQSQTAINNIVLNTGKHGIITGDANNTNIVSNNTVYNFNANYDGTAGYGIALAAGSGFKCDNNLVIAGAGGGDCYAFSSSTHRTNGSSDTTGDIDNLTAADLFVSTASGSENLHLKAGADAIDVGTDLGSTNGINIDIDGTTRSGTWDIGADEYVASTTYLSNVRFYEGN